MDHVSPYLSERKLRWQDRKEQRKIGKQDASPETVLPGVPVGDTTEVTDALEAYKANMSSAEARRHFTEALIAQRFVDEKKRLLAEARIEDDDQMRELASAVKALTPKQAEFALTSILASSPAMINDLAKLFKAARNDDGPQLHGGQMKAVPRLKEGR